MLKRSRWVSFRKLVVIVPLVISIAVPLYPALTNRTEAAAFSIRTGYYIGTGGAKSISGLGFQPQFILIKSNTSTNPGQIKTKDMATSVLASAGAVANSTGVTIDSDGFTLTSNTNVNNSGDNFSYTAFAGSDCTSSGTICIGTYSGDNTGAKTITTGFQPSLVIAKSSTAVAGHFKTASMPSANTEFLTSTANNTASAYIGTLSATGFSVGASDNATGQTYYYVAFKAGSSSMAEGSYTGDGTDDKNIAAPGFRPSVVAVKNSSSATTNSRRPYWTNPEQYGDYAAGIGDGLQAANNILQGLLSTGFQIGSAAQANESGATIYWFALGGDTSSPSGSGTFKMSSGTYTGTGSAQSVTGLTFSPDLIIIKDDAANSSVFRTSVMAGDATAYLGVTTGDFTGGITAINGDGFSVGTSTVVNTNGNTYRWEAFGNAYNPYTRTGSADFAVGSYLGNAVNNRSITGLPFQPDLIVGRRQSNGGASFMKTSTMAATLTGYFDAAAENTGVITAINSDGFSVGLGGVANNATIPIRWFAFKAGTNLSIGSYTGNGVVDRGITSPGFQPDLAWVKQSSTQAAVQRSSALSGDTSQYFTAVANAAGKIKSLTSTGFTVGTAAEVNTNAATYRFIAWKIPVSGSLSIGVVDSGGSAVASPAFSLSSIGFPFDCTSSTGTIGASSQRIRVTNTTASPAWSLTIAATGGTTSLWGNGGNTVQYDFNDTTTSGCADGADGDSRAGKMSIDASAGTLNPQSGCSNTNVSKGSSSDFNEGTVNSITLLSASASANTNCYWELTGVGVGQTIPAQQASDSYSLNLTVTITAS